MFYSTRTGKPVSPQERRLIDLCSLTNSQVEMAARVNGRSIFNEEIAIREEIVALEKELKVAK